MELVSETHCKINCLEAFNKSLLHFQTAPEFRIDNVTGVITSLTLIDYDKEKHEYRLVVDAIDEGDPQLVG